MGSPRYMSPEQARSARRVDARSDLWAFGVMLFRCLTGEELFEGETTGDIIVKICAEPIPTPSDVDPTLPRALDGFFRRALQRDVERRFQDATLMVAAFESVFEDTLQQERQPFTADPSHKMRSVTQPGGSHADAVERIADADVATMPLPFTPSNETVSASGTFAGSSAVLVGSTSGWSVRRVAGAALGVGFLIGITGWSSGAFQPEDPAATHALVDRRQPMVLAVRAAPDAVQLAESGEPSTPDRPHVVPSARLLASAPPLAASSVATSPPAPPPAASSPSPAPPPLPPEPAVPPKPSWGF